MTIKRNLTFLLLFEILLGVLTALRAPERFDSFYMPVFLSLAGICAAAVLLTGEGSGAPLTLCSLMLLITGTAAQAVCAEVSAKRWLLYLAAGVFLAAAVCCLWWLLLPKIHGGSLYVAILCAAAACGICVSLAAAKVLRGSAVQAGIGGLQLSIFVLPLFAFYLGIIYTSGLPVRKKYLFSMLPTGFCGLLLVYVSELGTLLMLLLLVLLTHYLCHPGILLFLAETAALVLAVFLGWKMLRLLADAQGGKVPEALAAMAAGLLEKLESRLCCGGDLSGAGYQLRTSVEAIALGGFFGTGYDVYVPVASSDMIFSVVALKFGFIVGMLVLLCFVRMLSFLKRLAACPCRDREKVIAVLLLSVMAAQSVYNITAGCGFVPIAGLPCAFLSLSGSYLSVCILTVAFAVTAVKKGEKECGTSKEECGSSPSQRSGPCSPSSSGSSPIPDSSPPTTST